MRKKKVFRTDRLGALSDGVFAIAMTLLVLDLKLPDGNLEDFRQVWVDASQKFDYWIISFLVIGASWVLHHDVLSLLKRTNTLFLWLNLIFLMFIAFMPWPTWLLGIYGDEPLAVVLFSGVIGMAGFMIAIQWFYAARGSRLTDKGVNLKTMKATTFLILRIPLVAVISIALAFVNTHLALWIWVLHAVLGYVIRRAFKEEDQDIVLAQ